MGRDSLRSSWNAASYLRQLVASCGRQLTRFVVASNSVSRIVISTVSRVSSRLPLRRPRHLPTTSRLYTNIIHDHSSVHIATSTPSLASHNSHKSLVRVAPVPFTFRSPVSSRTIFRHLSHSRFRDCVPPQLAIGRRLDPEGTGLG
jgi:hypothetical protein